MYNMSPLTRVGQPRFMEAFYIYTIKYISNIPQYNLICFFVCELRLLCANGWFGLCYVGLYSRFYSNFIHDGRVDAVCVFDDVDMTMLWRVVNVITDTGCESVSDAIRSFTKWSTLCRGHGGVNESWRVNFKSWSLASRRDLWHELVYSATPAMRQVGSLLKLKTNFYSAIKSGDSEALISCREVKDCYDQTADLILLILFTLDAISRPHEEWRSMKTISRS